MTIHFLLFTKVLSRRIDDFQVSIYLAPSFLEAPSDLLDPSGPFLEVPLARLVHSWAVHPDPYHRVHHYREDLAHLDQVQVLLDHLHLETVVC